MDSHFRGYGPSRKDLLRIECNESLSINIRRLLNGLEVRDQDKAAEIIMFSALWCLEQLNKDAEVGALDTNGKYTRFSFRELERVKHLFLKSPLEPPIINPNQFLFPPDNED